jgi:hypothetical protein
MMLLSTSGSARCEWYEAWKTGYDRVSVEAVLIGGQYILKRAVIAVGISVSGPASFLASHLFVRRRPELCVRKRITRVWYRRRCSHTCLIKRRRGGLGRPHPNPLQLQGTAALTTLTILLHRFAAMAGTDPFTLFVRRCRTHAGILLIVCSSRDRYVPSQRRARMLTPPSISLPFPGLIKPVTSFLLRERDATRLRYGPTLARTTPATTSSSEKSATRRCSFVLRYAVVLVLLCVSFSWPLRDRLPVPCSARLHVPRHVHFLMKTLPAS